LSNINKLLIIMKELRDPDNGCPWDKEQTFSTIAPYTIEEAYEVAEAVQRGDMQELQDELGDLLFQVVFHSQLAAEQEYFDFNDVILMFSVMYRSPMQKRKPKPGRNINRQSDNKKSNRLCL
jgi:ATP diphosphatase